MVTTVGWSPVEQDTSLDLHAKSGKMIDRTRADKAVEMMQLQREWAVILAGGDGTRGDEIHCRV
jgi:hypothetical protein